MLKIKAQINHIEPPDVGMRRLMGALETYQDYASKAYQRLQEHFAKDPYLSIEGIRQDHELVGWLGALMGGDWVNLITGSVY